MRQVESETADSELKLSNTTLRLLQLERDVSLLRESSLESGHKAEQTQTITDLAKQEADQAQQVHIYTHTHTHPHVYGL